MNLVPQPQETGLSRDEARRLASLEATIARGMTTFVEVGHALAQIRDQRLYRETQQTFEAYCRERWGFSRPHAYRLLDAAEVAGVLSPIGDIPQNEAQARELVSVLREHGPQAVLDVWRAAKANGQKLTAEAIRAAAGEKLAVHFSSESDAWNTPPEIIERTVRVLGRVDLDPCSNDGQPNVPARRHFTASDDGLSKPWRGRVYMNPPYGRAIGRWAAKLVEEFMCGRVSSAIALVPGRIDTEWWDSLHEGYFCFIRQRLVFGGIENPAPFPSAVVYFGPDRPSFRAAFADLGRMWRCDG